MAKDSALHQLRLDFENLPLMEATLRVTVAPPIKLRFSLIEKIRGGLGHEFPEVSEPSQIEAPPGIGQKVTEFGPGRIHGAEFRGNPKGLVITVQDQVIITRWRRQAGADASDYPRFQALQKALWDAFEALRKAEPDFPLKAMAVNLSYTNFLSVPDPSQVLSTYFSGKAQIDAVSGAEAIHHVEVSWRAPGSTDYRYRLEKARIKLGDKEDDGYILTTVAGRILPEGQTAAQTLDDVHNELQYFFLDLISEAAKKDWKLKGEHHA